MTELFQWVLDHQVLFETLGLVSLGLIVVSLVGFPLVVVNLPRDYFVRERRDPAHQTRRHPVLWAALSVAKNILGFVLVVAGIAMLVLPGQGMLTILVGLAVSNFPGKFRLERRLVSRPAVGRALNRIRRLAGRPELEIPAADD